MRPWLVLKILLQPLNWVQSRIDDWVMRRVKPQSGPIPIRRNRVYIVPTRFGWGFGATCVVMLLGAMNYSNSMAFALCFLLFGLGLVCMHHTHANLVHVQVRAGRSRPVFAGEPVHFGLLIENPSASQRFALTADWARQETHSAQCDVSSQGYVAVQLSVNSRRRGWLQAGVFSISTEFPLGLFHAWTWAQLDMQCLVFPSPLPTHQAPPQTAGVGGTVGAARLGQDEFAGLRDYQRGDAMKSIHWKSLPKTGKPTVKQFSETVEQALWFDWSELRTGDVEFRISLLTRWVLDAHGAGRAWGLRLPGVELEPACSDSHRFESLKALALYGQETPADG